MTTVTGPLTSLVSAHDADPLPQTKRNATAILDKHALCIEFLRSDVHVFSFFLRNFLPHGGVDARMIGPVREQSVARVHPNAPRLAKPTIPTGPATPTAP
jgi:hypothetical protein